MLDTAFIRNGVDDGRLVIYVYNSGILRSKVIQKLEALATARGQRLIADGPDEITTTLLGVGFFIGLGEYFSDIGKARPQALTEAVTGTGGLRSAANGVVALLIHSDNPIIKDQRWQAAVQYFCFIEEVDCAPEHIDDLMGIFSDALGPSKLGGQDNGRLRTSFRALIDQSEDLPSFIAAAKAAHYAGELAGSGDDRELEAVSRIGSAAVSFMIDPSRRNALKLIAAASAQLQAGVAETQICRTLVRVTHTQIRRRLSAQAGHGTYASGVVSTRQLIAWSGMLATSLAQIHWGRPSRYAPIPSRLIPWLDRLVSGYLSFCDDPLRDLDLSEADQPNGWAVAATESLRTSTADLVSILPIELEPDWLAQMRHASPKSDSVAVRDRPPVSRLIFGHPAALQELRHRVGSGDTSTPILLAGPPGVGKRTLAVHYATAALCKAALNGLPCGVCASCLEVQKGSSMAYVPPVDVAGASKETIEQIQKIMARGTSFVEHVSIVLLNVDMVAPALTDLLLKTIEEPGRTITLVLTATRATAVRAAVRSRSRVIKLRRLKATASHKS